MVQFIDIQFSVSNSNNSIKVFSNTQQTLKFSLILHSLFPLISSQNRFQTLDKPFSSICETLLQSCKLQLRTYCPKSFIISVSIFQSHFRSTILIKEAIKQIIGKESKDKPVIGKCVSMNGHELNVAKRGKRDNEMKVNWPQEENVKVSTKELVIDVHLRHQRHWERGKDIAN
jgi:hypothetical protein